MRTFPLYRIYRIVWMAVSFFIEIFWFNKRHKGDSDETEEAWNRLMQKQAKTYKKTAIQLGGLLIKLGQFLSARADLLPRVFIDELEGLVDHVPALPWEVAKQTLEKQWGRPYDEILHKISDGPVASASIGEVYHGYLHSGEEVAVKIQRRDIEKIMHIDFKAIRIVVWLMKHLTTLGRKINLEGLYRELVRVTNDELDFHKELDNGQFFKNAFSDNEDIYIPDFYDPYSTKKVLVMEWVEGTKVTDHSFLKKHGISPERLADEVVDCFIKQFLDLGRFHADPHSGNLFVRKDGTLVLIDFGMVSAIKKDDISRILHLIEGLLFEDFGKVFNALEELGFLLPSANEQELEHAIKTILDVYMHRGGREVDSDMMEEMLREITSIMHEQPIQLPSEFAFLGRAVSVLVGLLYSIDPNIDFLESARPAVNKWIEGEQDSIQTSAVEYVKDWAKPLVQIPALTRDYLKAPYRRMDWERERQKDRYLHDVYSSGKRNAAVAFLAGVAGLFVSLFFERNELAVGCALFSVLALIFYFVAAVRHSRWIRRLNERR
ncbi:MAG TPA: AarF/UbiB family protein [Bacillales bacterium]|nr:AarF/UbiB family protein [Bacillales bacterium]